jgi:hypothetical protein
MKTAIFKILNGDEVIKDYTMEYSSMKELNKLFHEARKVWSEYQVEVDFGIGELSYSHTYKEQVLQELAK